MGDMNFNLLEKSKSQVLRDYMNLYGLTNLITTPTFTSQHGSSLIDVAITNSKLNFIASEVIDIGVSDGHSMITVISRKTMPKLMPKDVTYRSYKTFNTDSFRNDFSMLPLSICDIFDDPSDALWAQETLIRDILDEHAPLKSKRIRPNEPPYMNKSLKKAIMNKARLLRRFKKTRTTKAWNHYKIQRNLTTSIRRRSVRKCLTDRCEGGPKNASF